MHKIDVYFIMDEKINVELIFEFNFSTLEMSCDTPVENGCFRGSIRLDKNRILLFGTKI